MVKGGAVCGGVAVCGIVAVENFGGKSTYLSTIVRRN